MDREKVPSGLQPSQNRLCVILTSSRFDSAIERVFEKPIKMFRRFSGKKIGLLEIGLQSGGNCFVASRANGGGCEVVTMRLKSSFGPNPHVMTRATTGHRHAASRQAALTGDEIHQSRRGFPFFPRHIASLVTLFPIGLTH